MIEVPIEALEKPAARGRQVVRRHLIGEIAIAEAGVSTGLPRKPRYLTVTTVSFDTGPIPQLRPLTRT